MMLGSILPSSFLANIQSYGTIFPKLFSKAIARFIKESAMGALPKRTKWNLMDLLVLINFMGFSSVARRQL